MTVDLSELVISRTFSPSCLISLVNFQVIVLSLEESALLEVYQENFCLHIFGTFQNLLNLCLCVNECEPIKGNMKENGFQKHLIL